MARAAAPLALVIAGAALLAGATALAEDEITAFAMTLAPGPGRIAIHLVVNEIDLGDIFALRGDGRFLVAAADLQRAGVDIGAVTQHLIVIEGEAFINLPAVETKIAYSMDEKNGVLKITLPTEDFRTTAVDLRRTRVPEGVVYASDGSAFLNYSLGATGHQLTLANELGISTHGVLIYSGLNSQYSVLTANHDAAIVRGLSNITIDRRSSLMQIIVGDALDSTGPLGGATTTGGVHLVRNFSLDPYYFRYPSFGYNGATQSPSTADVYVNGVLVRHVTLAPGPFSIDNLQPNAGLGQTRIVIQDAFGRQQEIGSSFYMATNVLGKGVSDYDYSVGFVRENVGTRSDDYVPPVLLAHHLFGLTNWFTGGYRFEAGLRHSDGATTEFVSGGPELAFASPFGQITAAGAVSTTRGDVGWAGFLSYGVFIRWFSLGCYALLTSPDYATASIDSTDDRALDSFGGSVSVPILRRASLSLTGTYDRDRDKGVSYGLSATAIVHIATRFSLTATASRQISPGVTPTDTVFAGLTISIGKQTTAELGYQYANAAMSYSAGVSAPAPSVGNGFGYSISDSLAPAADTELIKTNTVAGSALYSGPYGRYMAGGEYVYNNASYNAQVAGAIVLVGGHLFATKPVDQGFGLIQVPGVADVRGYVNNSLIGRTNSNGDLFVPIALPYYANRLSVDLDDLPLSYTIGDTSRLLAPTTRGGAVAKFPVARLFVARGRVRVLRAEKTIIPTYGEISVVGLPFKGKAQLTSSGALKYDTGAIALGHSSSSPIGEAGEFELSSVVPGAYNVEIKYDGGACEFQMEIPLLQDTFSDIGAFRCVER